MVAQSGRKPKLTAVKVLEGNPGKRSLNTQEPKPDQGNGNPPDPDKAKAARSNVFPVKAGTPLTIYGFGWGHGLGMSQYGAYQMAREHGEDAAFYRKILSHYYTGTSLSKLY